MTWTWTRRQAEPLDSNPTWESTLGPPITEQWHSDNEFYWEQISDKARAYLAAPRDAVEPCPWCGGRLTHNPLCDELRQSWLPRMPFGKHKGMAIDKVPIDYLRYLRRVSDSLPAEIEQAIDKEIEKR